MPHNFWMIVSNPENFGITRNLGFTSQGLKAQHRRKVQRIEPGDRVLFYVSGARKFTATATATSSYVEEESSEWQNEGSANWPFRIQIKPELVLDDNQFIDANLLAPRLDYVKRWPPENWYMAFQGNLHLLPKNDFLIIEEEMRKLKFGRNHGRGSIGPPTASPRRKKRRGPPRARINPEQAAGQRQAEGAGTNPEQAAGQRQAEGAGTNPDQAARQRQAEGAGINPEQAAGQRQAEGAGTNPEQAAGQRQA